MKTPEQVLENTVQRCRERNIIIPTYEEMADPERIPSGIRQELAEIGLWDLNPRNLFRITWKNQPVPMGGGFGTVNFVEIPPELTGVAAQVLPDRCAQGGGDLRSTGRKAGAGSL